MIFRLFTLILGSLFGLSSVIFGQTCNCKNNLDSLSKSIEENYVGFTNKVNVNNQYEYFSFKDSLLSLSVDAKDYDCFQVLKNYLSFFRDPHLNIRFIRPKGSYIDTIDAIFQKFPTVTLNKVKLKKYFRSKHIDQIEGIWQAKGLPFKIAIYKNKAKGFLGVTWETESTFWYQGQIKLEIPEKEKNGLLKYYNNDHYPSYHSYHIEGDLLFISGASTWERVNLKTETLINTTKSTIFKKLSDSSNLLIINSFDIRNKAVIDSIVHANFHEITNAKYLFIDIRNNGGGHIMSCDTLLPLLYTNPIVHDGSIVKSSRDNIDLYKLTLSNPNFSEDDKNAFREIIKMLEENIGSMVKISDPDTTYFPTEITNPKKIGIIINEGTTSTAELFLLWAKQSQKVTVFGTHTRGALDYTEIGTTRGLPCPYLGYTCPMGMTEHKVYPFIDNKGIKPDIEISENVPDWTKYVIQYYSLHQ